MDYIKNINKSFEDLNLEELELLRKYSWVNWNPYMATRIRLTEKLQYKYLDKLSDNFVTNNIIPYYDYIMLNDDIKIIKQYSILLSNIYMLKSKIDFDFNNENLLLEYSSLYIVINNTMVKIKNLYEEDIRGMEFSIWPYKPNRNHHIDFKYKRQITKAMAVAESGNFKLAQELTKKPIDDKKYSYHNYNMMFKYINGITDIKDNIDAMEIAMRKKLPESGEIFRNYVARFYIQAYQITKNKQYLVNAEKYFLNSLPYDELRCSCENDKLKINCFENVYGPILTIYMYFKRNEICYFRKN